jgi:hypothetical protein
MTTPSLQPADPEPGTATEPVPPPAPAPEPAVVQAAPSVSAASSAETSGTWAPPALTPVAPEGATGAAVASPASRTTRSGSSRILSIALVGALLIAAVGVSFAIGRASSSPDASNASVDQRALDGMRNGGKGGNNVPQGGGNRNGGPMNGAMVPGAGRGLGGNDDGHGFFGGGDGNQSFPAGGFRGGFGGPQVEGTVESVTSDSVTIKTASGMTVTVGLDPSTTYHQEVAATASDVQAGKTVQLQLSGGFRPDQGSSGDGTINLGTASDVTVVP